MVDKVKGITGYGYVTKNSGESLLVEMVEMALRLFSKQIELKESRDLYRSISSLTGEIIVRHDREGQWVFVNETGKREWGLPDDLSTPATYLDFIHPEDKDAALEARRRMENSHEFVSGLIVRQRTIRGWRTYQWNSAPMFDSEGNYAGFQATGRDVTERELAVQEIRENEQKYRWLAENTSDIVVVVNSNAVPEYVSPNFEETTGYSYEELRKHGIRAFCPAEEFDKLHQAIERDIANGLPGATYEYPFPTKDGQLRWWEASVKFVRDDHGDVSQLVFSARDITQRKEAEFRLHEKQEQIEQALERERLLLQEVHHRIKNDMNLVNSMLRLQGRQSANPEAQTLLNEAADRVTVLGNLYEMLYHDSDFEQVDAKPLVERLTRGLRTGTSPEGVTLYTECDEFSLPTKEGVSVGIILNELITNALKYGKGTSPKQSVRVGVRLGKHRELHLSVRDTGPGFPEQMLQGEYHGFGLTVVTALVEQHRGELKIRNEDGGVVEITLPLREASRVEPA